MSKKFSEFLTENKTLTDKAEIDKWLDQIFINNYEIRDDGTVDVDGNVEMNNCYLSYIPVKFGKVTGFFGCQDNKLRNLENCPTSVGAYFSCGDNPELTSLKGFPLEVGGTIHMPKLPKLTKLDFPSSLNNVTLQKIVLRGSGITSLDGIPRNIKVLTIEDCRNLTSLHNIHKQFDSLERLDLHAPRIKSHVLGLLKIKDLRHIDSTSMEQTNWDRIVSKYLPNTRGNQAVIDCQNELIDAGLDDYAQL